MSINCLPQLVFDLPHARAMNFFIVLNLNINKYSYDIGNYNIDYILKKGFAKYSLEDLEKENSNILLHNHILDVTWRTRKFGTLSFTASYKF